MVSSHTDCVLCEPSCKQTCQTGISYNLYRLQCPPEVRAIPPRGPINNPATIRIVCNTYAYQNPESKKQICIQLVPGIRILGKNHETRDSGPKLLNFEHEAAIRVEKFACGGFPIGGGVDLSTQDHFDHFCMCPLFFKLKHIMCNIDQNFPTIIPRAPINTPHCPINTSHQT